MRRYENIIIVSLCVACIQESSQSSRKKIGSKAFCTRVGTSIVMQVYIHVYPSSGVRNFLKKKRCAAIIQRTLQVPRGMVCTLHIDLYSMLYLTHAFARLYYNNIVFLLIIFALRSLLLSELFKNNLPASERIVSTVVVYCSNCGPTMYCYYIYLPTAWKLCRRKKHKTIKRCFRHACGIVQGACFCYIPQELLDLDFKEYGDAFSAKVNIYYNEN